MFLPLVVVDFRGQLSRFPLFFNDFNGGLQISFALFKSIDDSVFTMRQILIGFMISFLDRAQSFDGCFKVSIKAAFASLMAQSSFAILLDLH